MRRELKRRGEGGEEEIEEYSIRYVYNSNNIII